MKVILETERCRLRQFELTDAAFFYELNNDYDVLKYTGDCAFESIQVAETFLKTYSHYADYGFGRWAVIRKDDNQFLGWCGLKMSPEKKEVDLGFRFFKRYWNNGYATETGKECITYAFNKLNLKRIVGRVMQANIASIIVLEKLGMHFENKIQFAAEPGLLYSIKRTV